jgi:hypothetical protein
LFVDIRRLSIESESFGAVIVAEDIQYRNR